MELTGPVQKLLLALVLSGIKKGARTIRMNDGPLIVYFDLPEHTIEELRPPDQLRDRLVAELTAMSGAIVGGEPAALTVELGDGRRFVLAVQLATAGREVFRIALHEPGAPN